MVVGRLLRLRKAAGANVSVLNGDSKIIYADGAGSGAAVVDVTADLSFSSVNIDGGTIDGTVIGGASAAAGTFTTVTASGEIDGASLDISGNADIDGTYRDRCVIYCQHNSYIDRSRRLIITTRALLLAQ